MKLLNRVQWLLDEGFLVNVNYHPGRRMAVVLYREMDSTGWRSEVVEVADGRDAMDAAKLANIINK